MINTYTFERCTNPEGAIFWITDPWGNRIAIAYTEAYARLVVRGLNHLARYVPLEPPLMPVSAQETQAINAQPAGKSRES